MADFAQQARSRLSFIAEVTPGVTPTPTAVFKEFPVVSSGLNLQKTLITSSALNSNRRKKFSRHGNKSVGGDFSVEFSYGQYDDLLAGVMLADWATNVLKNGTTKKMPRYTSAGSTIR